MVSYIDIVKRLINYRQSQKITQVQLAEIFSVTQCEISKLEATEYRLSFSNLLQLHTKTSLDIDFLITGKTATNTIFHTLEKHLFPSSAAKYQYTDLILFCLNSMSELPLLTDTQNHLTDLQRLLRYSFLSGSHQKRDSWLNIRSAFGLTQIKMAEIMDIDIKRYRNIEKGKCTANAELLMNIYNALGICPSYFINGKIENYQYLQQIFQTFPKENQAEIVQFLKAGITFINQAVGQHGTANLATGMQIGDNPDYKQGAENRTTDAQAGNNPTVNKQAKNNLATSTQKAENPTTSNLAVVNPTTGNSIASNQITCNQTADNQITDNYTTNN